MDWLEEAAAIDTLVALGGLRVGDEIILRVTQYLDRRRDDWNIPIDYNGKVMKVTRLELCGAQYCVGGRGGREFRAAWVVELESSRGFDWEIGRKHIKAWRRP